MATSLNPTPMEVRSVDRADADERPPFFIGQVADGLTLAAVALSPLIKLSFAGGTISDLLLALVILARMVQFCGPGLDFGEIRRHAFMLTLLGLYAVAGFISSIGLGDPPSPEHVVVVFATLGSVLVVATYIRDQASITRLVKAYALGTVVLAISSMVMRQRADLGRAIGLSTHPNFLGHACMVGSAASLYMLERAETRRTRVLWILAAGMQVLGLLRSGSRGSFLGVVVAGFLYLCLSRDRRYVFSAIAVCYLAVMLLALGAVRLPAGNPITRLMSHDAQTQGSNREREAALDKALTDIRESPVFGKGSKLLIAIHVVYLQAWVGAGALGAFSIMFLGAAMFLWPLVQPRSGLALACGACAVAVAWLFTNLLGLRDQWLFLAIAMRASSSPLAMLQASSWSSLGPLVEPRT